MSGVLADAVALITAIAIAVLVAAVRARWGLDVRSAAPPRRTINPVSCCATRPAGASEPHEAALGAS